MNLHELWHTLLVWRRRMHVKITEQAAEREMLLGRDNLIPKEDDEVLGERSVKLDRTHA
jgi:hypothetical protein